MKNFVFAFFFIFVVQSHATLIKNTLTNEARLGSGIKVSTEQVFPSCLKAFTRTDLVAEDSLSGNQDPKGAAHLEVTSEVIRSYQKLDEYLNESISAEVQYMAYSGGGHYNHERQVNLSSDQITVGIQASTDYGRWYLRDPQLKPEYKSMSKSNLKSFYQSCGNEFVSGYRLGQGIKILLRTLDTSSYSYEKIDAGANASVKGVQGSGSIQAAFLNVASSLLKYSSLEVRIIGFGTQGLSSTSEILRTPKDVEKILEVLSKLLEGITPDNAVVTEYLTSTYPIQDQPYRAVLGEAQKRSLGDLYSAFRQIDADFSRMRKYVNVSFYRDFQDLCEFAAKHQETVMSCQSYAVYVAEQTQALEKARASLVSAIQKCATSERIADCELADLDVQLKLAVSTRLWPGQYRRKLEILKYKQEIEEIIHRSETGNRD